MKTENYIKKINELERENFYKIQCLIAEDKYQLNEPFIPQSLKCYACQYDLFEDVRIIAIIKSELITGCPACMRSFC